MLYTPVPKAYQQKALVFLNEHVFTTPEWLLDAEILRRIEHAGTFERVQQLQARHLRAVLSPSVISRLNEYHSFDGSNYAPLEMLTELRRGIWKEVYGNATIDPYRRNLQRVYLEIVKEFFENDTIRFGRSTIDIANSDIRPILRIELNELQGAIKANRASERLTQAHLEDVLKRIDAILNPK